MSKSLRFVATEEPGITRRSIKGHWAYFAPDENRITDREEIDRLNAIALPPAYSRAWFALDPASHILATGIDAQGRKQYRYHPDFRAQRDSRKFGHCADFARRLPLIRARVEKDLAKRALSAERAIASVVRLLDSGRIRVGNEAYAKANRSFGATTLRARHARIDGRRLTLRFRAKSGKQCTLNVTDRSLIRFARQVQDLPGQHLFQYLDEEGHAHPISSSQVNDYIREAMGDDFTAKDFRTWTASALAFEWLASGRPAKLGEMLAHVAEHLGNTPAIARKSYVHPMLIEAVQAGDCEKLAERLPRRTQWLTRHERGLIALLDAKSA